MRDTCRGRRRKRENIGLQGKEGFPHRDGNANGSLYVTFPTAIVVAGSGVGDMGWSSAKAGDEEKMLTRPRTSQNM